MTKEKYIDVKNIEKELKKIIKDNRSHNGLERSEWQAVYSENISRGQLNRPLRTYYITTKAPSGNYVGGDGPSILADKNIPISLYWYTSVPLKRDDLNISY